MIYKYQTAARRNKDQQAIVQKQTGKEAFARYEAKALGQARSPQECESSTRMHLPGRIGRSVGVWLTRATKSEPCVSQRSLRVSEARQRKKIPNHGKFVPELEHRASQGISFLCAIAARKSCVYAALEQGWCVELEIFLCAHI